METAKQNEGKSKPRIRIVYVVKQDPERFEIARTAGKYILLELGRYRRMHEQIDEAFGGQPFWPHLRATHPKNRRRFRAYWNMRSQVTGKVLHLLNEFLRVHGIDPKHPDHAYLNGDGWVQQVPPAQPIQTPEKDPGLRKFEEMLDKCRAQYSEEREGTTPHGKAGDKCTNNTGQVSLA